MTQTRKNGYSSPEIRKTRKYEYSSPELRKTRKNEYSSSPETRKRSRKNEYFSHEVIKKARKNENHLLGRRKKSRNAIIISSYKTKRRTSVAKSKRKNDVNSLMMESFFQRIIEENKAKDKKLFDELTQKRNTTTKTIEILNTICTDSGECLIIGRENQFIKKLFSGFSNFEYLTDIERVGEPSVNGFVLNLQYEKMNYKVNTLLKSAKNEYSDNLYYEYLVGTSFINRVNQIFPCFTETYGLFKHKSDDTKEEMEVDDVIPSELMDMIESNICDEKSITDTVKCMDDACFEGENFALLLQYVNNPISLKEFVRNNEEKELFEAQMISILFQIYAPLSYLTNEFTHYDLHTGNVILYKLPEGKYVTLKYRELRIGETPINYEIKTNYIAKIIDYGRCFIGDLGNDKYLNSEKIGKIMYSLPQCSDGESTRGEAGLSFFDKTHTQNNHYLSSLLINRSHDLRLANIVKQSSYKMDKFFDNRIVYDGRYGTKEKDSDETQNINNVEDMMKFLQTTIINRKGRYVDLSDNSIGTLDIYMTDKYCERPMTFTQTNIVNKKDSVEPIKKKNVIYKPELRSWLR